MRKQYVLALAVALSFVVSAAIVQSSSGKVLDNDSPSAVAIGSTIADFKLPDASGTERTLSSIKGKNGTAMIFISTRCPVSNGYNARMEKLAQDYAGRGITVVGINSNVAESADDIKAHAAENHLTFMILKDKGNKIADRLGAERTPEVYLLDANNKLVYHGRIDNHKNPDLVTANDLRDAMDAVLAGKPVAKTEAAAFGCSIKRAS